MSQLQRLFLWYVNSITVDWNMTFNSFTSKKRLFIILAESRHSCWHESPFVKVSRCSWNYQRKNQFLKKDSFRMFLSLCNERNF